MLQHGPAIFNVPEKSRAFANAWDWFTMNGTVMSTRPGRWPLGETRTQCGLLALLALACVAGCSDTPLQPADPDELERVDNLLTIRGEYCAEPDAEVVFPVKVMLAVDQSNSLQCTDNRNRRFDALNSMIDDLRESPSTQVGFLGFANWVRELPFTRDRAAYAPFLDPAGGLGPATDYQGTLATILRMIEQDILDTDPSERARTRYVIVMVSDGSPMPLCLAGCEDDITNCTDGRDNDGDGLSDGSDPDCADINNASIHPDILSGVCNTDEEIPDDVYVDFSGVCPAYNTTPQILQRVRDLLQLQDLYSVGGISLNTVLLFSPQPVVESVCPDAAAAFGLEQDSARALLQAMAAEGNGTFRDANLAMEGDDFLQFDFRSLQAEKTLMSLTAQNHHAVLTENGWSADTDRDGLSDADEDEAGTDPDNPDSDIEGGDGYTDLFEQRLVGVGFDALDNTVPALACTETGDLDGDRLRDCEESFLGTDLRHADTDGDGLSDFVEFERGTDPLEDDVQVDLDFDGLLNEAEILAGSDPLIPDAERNRIVPIQYERSELGRKDITRFGTNDVEERQCYEFEVADMQLVVTPLVPDRGLNRILVHSMEGPNMLAGARSVSYVACFEAFLYGESAKSPADGIIDVREEAWEQTLSEVQGEIDSLSECPDFPALIDNRDPIVAAVRDCLPEGIPLDGFEVSADDAVALVEKYVATNGAVNMPTPSSELFVPLESFNPNRHCYRPWELDRLSELFRLTREACQTCGEEEPADP